METKLSCLVIEDEPLAAELLVDYIKEVSFLEFKGVCIDAIYALERLKKEHIDVIFLDIHLPKLKGLDFLKLLKHKPQTILTTAYHKYAIEAFDEDVVDYLLKPIEFSRFIKAVNKLTLVENANNIQPKTARPKDRAFHFFNVNKKMVKVYVDDILYIESLKDYVRILMSTGSMVTQGQLGEMELLFSESNFIRIHRSYMVSLDKIKSFSSTEIAMENSKSLPIGRSYKEHVSKVLNSYSRS